MTDPDRSVRIRLLGEFGCSLADGKELVIAAKKARGVLAYLALARRGAALREHVAAMFWSLSGEEQARQSLRQCVSALRRALNEGDRVVLCTDGDQVSVDLARVEVDVLRIREALEADTPSAEAADLATGLLLQDHVFGEDPIDDWVRDERARVLSESQRLLLACARAEEEAGDDAAAAARYRQLLELNPPSEEAHRGLMLALSRMGERTEALAQYHRCRDAMTRHMDAAPSEETTQLFEQLRGGAAPADPEPAAARDVTLPLPDKPSIVVLPFTNLSGNDQQTYLCRGIGEDITTSLSQFSSLFVIASGAAANFAPGEVDVREIGRRLGVHYVLQGSLQSAGKQLRVSAQLVEGEHGRQIWSQRYEGSFEDVFSFQDDLVQRVVATTVGRVEADALERARRKSPERLDAYECVLRGRYHHHLRTPEDSKLAISFFEKALEQQPVYPLAAGWLACARARAVSFSMDKTQRVNSGEYLELLSKELPKMLQQAAQDQEETECLRLVSEIYLIQRNFEEAGHYLRRAYKFNPSDDRILTQMAAFLAFTGEPEEAVRLARLAIRINPYHSGFFQFNLGRALMLTEQYEDALVALRAASPQENRYRAHIAASLVALGRRQEARAVADDILTRDPRFTLEWFRAALLYQDERVTEHLLSLMAEAGLPR